MVKVLQYWILNTVFIFPYSSISSISILSYLWTLNPQHGLNMIWRLGNAPLEAYSCRYDFDGLEFFHCVHDFTTTHSLYLQVYSPIFSTPQIQGTLPQNNAIFTVTRHIIQPKGFLYATCTKGDPTYLQFIFSPYTTT
jgi:hypothetical protein